MINIGKSKFFYPINQQQGITLSDKYDSFKSYALCVSHLYPYKNIPRMIEAFAIAKRITESDHKLLIAGNKKSNKYYNQIIDTINKLNLQNTVILLGAVSKEDLRYLYSSCKFFVFPSPYENFAITLVEAMCCGAAIICANTTAMPETCQEAAMYFDPNNTEEMAEKIEFFMSNEELRNSLKQKSLNRVKELPDYKTVTIKTLDIMNNIVQK